ncbi:MAG: YgaP-like transmembrane domain [Chthoniobacterales bacterium]
MALTTQPFAHVKALDDIASENRSTNVSHAERIGSLVAGSALIVLGLAKRSTSGVLLSLVGGLLVHRGVTGHCRGYAVLGVDTARHDHRGVPGNHGHKIERSIRIHRPANEIFTFWRNLENIPKFMARVKFVEASSGQLSHWVAKGPGGVTVEWDAEVINEHPDQMIAWQSLPGAEIESAGSVWFTPHGDMTEVKLSMQYHPPMGAIGDVVTKFLGDLPDREIEEDLARLKQLMENA